jgi:hypothetical protein
MFKNSTEVYDDMNRTNSGTQTKAFTAYTAHIINHPGVEKNRSQLSEPKGDGLLHVGV